MAGRRRRRFYRRYKKRRSNKKIATVGSVKKMINKFVETKQIAYNYAASLVSAVGGSRYSINKKLGNAGVSLVTGVVNLGPGQQGVGGYQIIGNKILIKEIEFNVQLWQVAAAMVNDRVRAVLVWDKKCQGVDISSTELFYDAASGQAITSPYKQTGKQQYKILYDKTIELGNQGSATLGISRKQIHVKKKFPKGILTTYYADTTATTVASIIDNHLEMMLFASSTNVQADDAYTNMIYQDA